MRPQRGSSLSVSALNAYRQESKGSTRLNQAAKISAHRTRTATNNKNASSSATPTLAQEAQLSDRARNGRVRHKYAEMGRAVPSRGARDQPSGVGKNRCGRRIYTAMIL